MANQQFQVVKMHFDAPLHLSRGQTDAYDKSEEIIHSDSLKSAIFVAARMLFGDEVNESFFDGFKVSSAFIFGGDEYFFPKPMFKLTLDFQDAELGESKKSKKLKKLTWISKDIFEKLINGENVDIQLEQFSENGKFLFQNQPVETSTSEVHQRLAMPSGNEKDGTPYYVERIYFSKDSGLYFFIDYGKDETIRKKLEAALKLLGDEGIGTDKHVGNGTFTPDWINLSFTLPTNAGYSLPLSLYCPEKEEIKKDVLERSSWQLIKRGGYIASPENIDFMTFRKRSIYMFTEASVFAATNLKGKKVNLKPENIKGLNHPVWRDGRAFFIPVKLKENG